MTPSTVREPARANSRRAQDHLETALVHALGTATDPGGTLCVTLDAPVAAAERLLSLPDHDCRVLWSPSIDDESAGVGTAQVLTGTGKHRFVRQITRRRSQSTVR